MGMHVRPKQQVASCEVYQVQTALQRFLQHLDQSLRKHLGIALMLLVFLKCLCPRLSEKRAGVAERGGMEAICRIGRWMRAGQAGPASAAPETSSNPST